ncbi:hypothetical protein HK099_008330 [Clydaea vesicula]|uniref:Uncharacterized protein n=1 Tax=Clydaea vesicula TaxID=447962 RepID=A0AAD5XXT3_9FUNG|nr:hypothetical protein HK099_008330 [Clydaea vesicula]
MPWAPIPRVTINFLGFPSGPNVNGQLGPASSRRVVFELNVDKKPKIETIFDLLNLVKQDPTLLTDKEVDPHRSIIYTNDFVPLARTAPVGILRDGDVLIAAFHGGYSSLNKPEDKSMALATPSTHKRNDELELENVDNARNRTQQSSNSHNSHFSQSSHQQKGHSELSNHHSSSHQQSAQPSRYQQEPNFSSKPSSTKYQDVPYDDDRGTKRLGSSTNKHHQEVPFHEEEKKSGKYLQQGKNNSFTGSDSDDERGSFGYHTKSKEPQGYHRGYEEFDEYDRNDSTTTRSRHDSNLLKASSGKGYSDNSDEFGKSLNKSSYGAEEKNMKDVKTSTLKVLTDESNSRAGRPKEAIASVRGTEGENKKLSASSSKGAAHVGSTVVSQHTRSPSNTSAAPPKSPLKSSTGGGFSGRSREEY